ncbi:hypothetical protein VTP01DRAFT_7330 [Rhizomucor pusillus]|uniref:uncharacterized protein n=1 Tax=Rhizomucor pusillus TaxID=4840 RepID=UPI003742D871
MSRSFGIKKQWLIPLCLGQILSLCITGTSTASSALWQHHSVNIPFTQNFLTYILLATVHGARLDHDRGPWLYLKRLSKGEGWGYLGFSFADVQANVLAVLAFRSTSVLSALVVSSWTLPCIMLLSRYLLYAQYRLSHFGGVSLCLAGLSMLIWTDTKDDGASQDNHSWIGDVICLLSATLYAVSNVTEEYLVKRCTTAEFLSRAGFWGSIICGVQAFAFEHHAWMQIEWSWPIVIYVSIYVTSLLCMYSLGPTVYRLSNATFLSMSLITSNFYTLLIGLVFLDAEMPRLYPFAYILVLLGAATYNFSTPPSSKVADPERLPILSKDVTDE